MSADRAELEQLVRSVVARLAATGQAEVAPMRQEPGTLDIQERVVTVATLAGQVERARRVTVLQRAVVTPAARDFLSERKIELVRRSEATRTTEAPASHLLVGVAEVQVEPSRWLYASLGRRIEFEQLPSTCLTSVVDALAEPVARWERCGLLFTASPEAAVCLANRKSGVRAILATNVDGVKRARQSMAANLLVVEPAAHSPFAVRQMAAALLAPGTYTCDEVIQSRLK